MSHRNWSRAIVLLPLMGLLALLLVKYTHLRISSIEPTKVAFYNVLWDIQKDMRVEVRGLDWTKMKMKKIVYWTPFSTHEDYGFGFGHSPFVAAKCKVSMCRTTSSKAEVADADAVIFHIPNLRHNIVYPPTRLPHQLYIMFVRECPAHIHLKNILRFNNFFNISMLYSREADILFPHGRIEKRAADVPYIPYEKDIVQKKTKFALALISHCDTAGKREMIIEALRKYIPIDVLGGCNKANRSTLSCESSFELSCMRKIMSKYKYYFAFESFLCRDYASVKLYKVLDLPVIPVVYGGSNYSDFIPPHSYIDVQDFKTAASLAAYLKDVASDTDKFLSYFTWRKDFRQTVDIIQAPGPYMKPDPRMFCDLCEYLHVIGNKTKVISDILSLYGPKKYCVDPGKWLKDFLN